MGAPPALVLILLSLRYSTRAFVDPLASGTWRLGVLPFPRLSPSERNVWMILHVNLLEWINNFPVEASSL